MEPAKSKHPLPAWPQKANHLRAIRGLRRKLLREIRLVNELAEQSHVPTKGRSVLQVLDDLEFLAQEMPSSSPTFVDYQAIRNKAGRLR